MGLSEKDIDRLGPAARKQIEAAKKASAAEHVRRQLVNTIPAGSDFDSRGEYEFYLSQIYPGLQSGSIVEYEMHKTFDLLPAAEYCDIKLHSCKYTPDFFITYANGHKEAVEIKGKVVRKLQGDGYAYRRRLFIELYAKPNNWGFREIKIG